MTRLSVICAGLLGVTLVLGSPAQVSWSQSSISAKISAAARVFAESQPQLQALNQVQRQRIVEFVIGNALFTLGHELGHAMISLLDLPVLGREEDAADTFATLSLLHIGTEFTRGVLVDTARGLTLVAERRDKSGRQPDNFYDEHGLDQQRAYQIICLMVGSDPNLFRQVAERAKLSQERQETCQQMFEQAQDSWARLLQPHMRTASSGKPSFLERLLRLPSRVTQRAARIDINYSSSPPELASYRQVLMSVGLLEAVRDFGSENFALPRSLTIEAKSCGEPNAYWDPSERKVALCYELVALYAALAMQPEP